MTLNYERIEREANLIHLIFFAANKTIHQQWRVLMEMRALDDPSI